MGQRWYSGATRGQWLAFLPGIYPSYSSAEQYERNMRRMDANRSRAQSMGAVRDGPALLAGLVRCGRCGRRMTVRYQRGPGVALQPSYTCGMAASTWAEERCQQLSGTCVDEYVSGLALQAMAPAALELSLAAAEQEGGRRAETDRTWRQRHHDLDRARLRAGFMACAGKRDDKGASNSQRPQRRHRRALPEISAASVCRLGDRRKTAGQRFAIRIPAKTVTAFRPRVPCRTCRSCSRTAGRSSRPTSSLAAMSACGSPAAACRSAGRRSR